MFETLHHLARRLRRALKREEFERQLGDELRFHVDSEAAELVRRGVPPAEARRRARAAFGGFDRWQDEARATRATNWMEILARDARLALRSLARSPSYSVPAIATLALGIGAMASIASLAYDVLFRPLPYRDPARLVAVFERNLPRTRDRNVVSATAFVAWRERSRTLDSVSALMPATRVWLAETGPERLSGAEVSPGLFALLGRSPALGPGFSPGTPVNEVVLSHRFWSQRLGADSSIIGQRIRFDGEPMTVVGVMRPDFIPLNYGWMGDQEFWLPFNVTPQTLQWGRFLLVCARLRAGATFDAVGRELQSIHAQLRAEGTVAEGWEAHAIPLAEELSGSVRPAFYALLVACALLLLMVLTNTSLLTIAHTRRRAGDQVLRSVLGATRGRLIAERLVTAGFLALGGVISGVALSAWAILALTRFLPADVPRLGTVHFGVVAVLVAAGVGILATLLLAVIPSLDQRGAALPATLQGGARLTRRAHTSWVVISEAAAAVVLTLFAGLTLRSYAWLSSVDVGFDPTHLVAFRVAFDTPAESQVFFERLRASPGVVAAGRTSVRPFHQGGTATTITPVGQGEEDRSKFPTADVRFVDAGYFATLGLTPLSGRLFSASDRAGGPLRAVVNEALVKALFPAERDVLGRQFDLRIDNGVSPEIVGVVGDVRLFNPRSATRPTVYIFTGQRTAGDEYDVLVRASGDESAVIPPVRAAARSVSASTPLFRVESMRRTLDQTIARERVTAQLLVFFAVAALLLVAIGVYGLYAGEVTRRRREIGVRMALGATSGTVVRSMLVRALAWTAAGVAVGTGAGLAASRVLRNVLFGVPTTDLLSYAAAALIVVMVALGATLMPALQASGVEPSTALRAE